MSYILEALRKSERERAQGNVPTLETVSRNGAGNGSLWLGAGIGAGILLLLATIAWFVNAQFFRDPASLVNSDIGNGSTGDASAEATVVTGREPAPSGQVGRTDNRPIPDGAGQEAARGVANISGLEPAARRRIEELSLNVVSYSEVPERRFVMLNQRIVRESETVGDGVVVKRITPKGALLSVGDYEIMIKPD